MICINAAGGTVGSEVVRQLASAALPLRAAYFSKDKVAAVDQTRLELNAAEAAKAAGFRHIDRAA